MRFQKVKEVKKAEPPIAKPELPKINLQAPANDTEKAEEEKKEVKSVLSRMRSVLRSNIDRSNKSILSAVSRRVEMMKKQHEKEQEKSDREDENNEASEGIVESDDEMKG